MDFIFISCVVALPKFFFFLVLIKFNLPIFSLRSAAKIHFYKNVYVRLLHEVSTFFIFWLNFYLVLKCLPFVLLELFFTDDKSNVIH